MIVSSFCGGGCCAWWGPGSAPWRFIYSKSDCIVSFDVGSDVVVAMGILGDRAGELFLFGSDFFSFPFDTSLPLVQLSFLSPLQHRIPHNLQRLNESTHNQNKEHNTLGHH